MATSERTAFKTKKLSVGRLTKSVAGSTLTQAQRNEKVSRALATASKSTGAFETKYAKG